MTESIKINPEWIIWSRKSLNYTLESASKKLKVQESTLSKWEETGILTYKNMNKLAKVYDVSPLLFLNNTPPPKIEQYVKDYRTMNDKRILSSPEILKEIKHAKRKRLLLLEIADKLDKDLSFKYYQNENKSKTKIVEIIRESLDINADKLNNYTTDDWIKEFEALNILIFKFYNIKPSDINGYAFNNQYLPIIGINNRNSEIEKIYSLFNEYAHLLISKDGISGDYNTQKDERLCNSIASEIMLPEKEIKKIKIANINSVIRIVSTRYNVNMETVLYRLRNLNLLTDEELEEQLNKRVYNSDEETIEQEDTQSELLVDNTKLVKKSTDKKKNNQKRLKNLASRNINQNGRLYTQILLEAYDNNIINDLDLSNELGVPHSVIPYLINKISGVRR
ncbi:MAG: ImmA/IrrE family metallo-endopeptidase [Methanosphaera sp.]|nr:ImmA/IrrE family metallo-endopeptidase [Methanosphaera sp.]